MSDFKGMIAAAALINARRPDLKAEAEHTGGGVFCIRFRTAEMEKEDDCWSFGTANENWGGSDYYGERNIETKLPSDCLDPDKIAEAILGAVRYVCPECGSPQGFRESSHQIVRQRFGAFEDFEGGARGTDWQKLEMKDLDIDSAEVCENDRYQCVACGEFFDEPKDMEGASDGSDAR